MYANLHLPALELKDCTTAGLSVEARLVEVRFAGAQELPVAGARVTPGKEALTPPRGRTRPTKDRDCQGFAVQGESAKSIYTLAYSKMPTWRLGYRIPHQERVVL